MPREIIIRTDDDARQALHAVVKDIGISLSALADQTGLSVGSVTRYANKVDRMKDGKLVTANNIWLSTLLRALDGAGYELVVRPKVNGSRRERRLAALRERNNVPGPGVRPDPS